MTNLIQQGAEAKIYLDENKILKTRIPKSYRHPTLDQQIRKSRTKKESKILTKALSLGINVPKVLNSNQKGEPLDKFNLELEYINGDKLSKSLSVYQEDKQFIIMEKLGEQVARLHENNIIHGDLTTSNTIFLNDSVFIIDFGLGFTSTKIEDKAVDLHLIKQALEAKHWQNHEDLFKHFLIGYNWDKSNQVVERLEIVEKRGRYKHSN